MTVRVDGTTPLTTNLCADDLIFGRCKRRGTPDLYSLPPLARKVERPCYGECRRDR